MSGIYGRALDARPVPPETQHVVRAMRGILRDHHGTIRLPHPACIATTGANEEMKNKKSNVANLMEAQWVRGKALLRGNRAISVEEGAERLRPSTSSMLFRKEATLCMYHERCEMCGNRWQRIPLTMVARDPETTLNNRTALASTGKRPVEIERPFCPHEHGSMLLKDTPQQSLHWECSTCSTTSGLSLDGCDVRLVDRESFEGADANMVPIGDDETPCLEKCRGN